MMGYLLLIGGFLLGAYATALDVQATDWSLFVPGAAVAIVGLLMLKSATRGEATSERVLTANRTELRESIGNVVNELDAIQRAAETLTTDDLRHQIDDRLRDDLRRFAEARESMVHLFGIQTYADIMSDFAAGERNVNRVWSASTDGYRAEALTYLERASGRFHAAQQRLEAAATST